MNGVRHIPNYQFAIDVMRNKAWVINGNTLPIEVFPVISALYSAFDKNFALLENFEILTFEIALEPSVLVTQKFSPFYSPVLKPRHEGADICVNTSETEVHLTIASHWDIKAYNEKLYSSVDSSCELSIPKKDLAAGDLSKAMLLCQLGTLTLT